MKKYITDKTFEGIDFTADDPVPSDYENCTFINCLFAGFNLSDYSFEDCLFEQCDLSNANLIQTAFKNVDFKSCKLIGLQFDTCNDFLLKFRFEKCNLNYASFYGLKIPKTRFIECMIVEADFKETNLKEAAFTNCNLSGSMFENTNLQDADLRDNAEISLDPEMNQITGAKFSLENLPGLLQKYNISIG